MVHSTSDVQKLFIHVVGMFDVDAARTVLARVAAGSPAALVVIDFAHAAVVHDAALQILVDGMARHGGSPPQLEHLTGHHQRIVQYLAHAQP